MHPCMHVLAHLAARLLVGLAFDRPVIVYQICSSSVDQEPSHLVCL